MATAAVALGSNLPSRFGSPADNIREAVRRLEDVGQVTAVSGMYETDPVGIRDQPRFTNAAALIRTTLSPLEVLRQLLAIERLMGRDRTTSPLKGPRLIDLDLLLFEGSGGPEILRDPDLTLPHPAMHERGFVLQPLAEIAPSMCHPVLHRTIAELLSALGSQR